MFVAEWWLFLPLLEELLVGLRLVAETASLSIDAFRVLVRTPLGLVLLVHVLSIATSHFAA